jgi:hypothetical protein
VPRHKHVPMMEVKIENNPKRVKQFCRCGHLRYITYKEPECDVTTPWDQAETLDELWEYIELMARAKSH